MALKFQYILSGKGVGGGEKQGQAFVQLLSPVIPEGAVVGITGFGNKSQQGLGNVRRFGAGYPHNPHPAPPRGGGNRGNGVLILKLHGPTRQWNATRKKALERAFWV